MSEQARGTDKLLSIKRGDKLGHLMSVCKQLALTSYHVKRNE
jgi:hypothetical protein